MVSHIGEVHVPKDFGKIMGLFSKDVLEDFLKEHGGEYVKKIINKQVELIKEK